MPVLTLIASSARHPCADGPPPPTRYIACATFAAWAHLGFPAAIISVFGADFVFASGSLFVAKVCLPHEQSVGGALFHTLTQLGTAFGLAISTIVHDATLAADGGAAQFAAIKDAMWTGFAFGIVGASFFSLGFACRGL